ncbi:MAG: hypothetical protein GY696_07030 [Gammaproteobacteria bacterium]|nr:hypothetical protein [Gammaproteobacteria bacterium]
MSHEIEKDAVDCGISRVGGGIPEIGTVSAWGRRIDVELPEADEIVTDGGADDDDQNRARYLHRAPRFGLNTQRERVVQTPIINVKSPARNNPERNAPRTFPSLTDALPSNGKRTCYQESAYQE